MADVSVDKLDAMDRKRIVEALSFQLKALDRAATSAKIPAAGEAFKAESLEVTKILQKFRSTLA